MFDSISRLLGLPVNASVHGKSVDDFIIYVHLLMGALFVIWMIYFAYVLWRFNEKRHPRADHHGVQSKSSTYLEVAVVVVEAVFLIGFAIPLWAHMVDDVPETPGTNRVKVMAQQFAWHFMYPGADGEFGAQRFELVSAANPFGRDLDDPQGQDDFMTYNDLRIPLGEPTVFQVSSLDVIHSFKVIALRICQDTIPGQRVDTWCVPTQEGRYQINCAQLCGNGHSAMTQGFLTVHNREEFDTWVANKSAEAVIAAGSGDAGGFE